MFKIILTKNKKRKKILHTCKKEETAYNRFQQLLNLNENILCTKRTLYNSDDHKFSKIDYEIVLIKKRTEEDRHRILKDTLGKTVDSNVKGDKWIILRRSPYDLEEEFKVHGFEEMDGKDGRPI